MPASRAQSDPGQAGDKQRCLELFDKARFALLVAFPGNRHIVWPFGRLPLEPKARLYKLVRYCILAPPCLGTYSILNRTKSERRVVLARGSSD